MIANYQQPGAAIDYTTPTSDTIKAGQVVSLSTRIGVAGTEIPAAAVGSLHVKGVFTMDKASGAIALGAAVYYSASTDTITTAASGAVPAGWAIAAAKAYAPFVRKIEVETETLDMVREAVEAGADIIMLDNMSPAEMAEAIRIIDGRAETECSGNMTIENIKTITALGVDYVSSGALTHSAPILDISLKNLHAVE